MVKQSLIGLSFVMASLVSVSANAAVVYWEPTNLDVNYSYSTDVGFSMAMFDVDDFDGLKLNQLDLNPAADTIEILAAGGGDYSATSTVTASSITLFNDNQFVVALTDGTDWFEPVSWTQVVPNTNIYDITFANGTVLSIDAVPTLVPVPAAVWLFGTGLLGLVGVARRRV